MKYLLFQEAFQCCVQSFHIYMKHLVGGKTELYFYSRLVSAHSFHILAKNG